MITVTKTEIRTKLKLIVFRFSSSFRSRISFSFRCDLSFSYCYHHRSRFVIGSKWCVIDHGPRKTDSDPIHHTRKHCFG